MAESIAEQIVAAVKTRLADITTGNGYQFSVAGIQRPKRYGAYTPTDLQAVVTQGAITRVTELDHPGNPPAIAYGSTIQIAVNLMPNRKTDTLAADTWRHRAAASVIKAVTSVSNWHNWGGLAINTEFEEPDFDTQDDAGNIGVIVPIVVTFRVSETDPYTARA